MIDKSEWEKGMPEEYASLINQDQYQKVLEMAEAYLNRKGTVVKIEPGMITVKMSDGQEVQCGLDNLIRIVAQQEEEEWFETIGQHFDRIQANIYTEPLKMDWEEARQYLKTRVYPESFGHPEIRKQMVYKTDFEGTFTNLILDYQGRFHLLTKRMVARWDQPLETLFSIAQENINAEEIKLTKGETEDGTELYCFFSGDFSASYLVDFQTNAYFCVGEYGTLVALPTKGVGICIPLNDRFVLERVKFLAPLVNQFYQKDPGHITNKFYWFYEGSFLRFRYEAEKEDKIMIRLPYKLEELLKED